MVPISYPSPPECRSTSGGRFSYEAPMRRSSSGGKCLLSYLWQAFQRTTPTAWGFCLIYLQWIIIASGSKHGPPESPLGENFIWYVEKFQSVEYFRGVLDKCNLCFGTFPITMVMVHQWPMPGWVTLGWRETLGRINDLGLIGNFM